MSVDVIAFDEAIARQDTISLEKAVELYCGPLLEDCREEWICAERERRAEAYLTALETLAARAAACRNRAEAARYLRRTVASDPLRETAQQALLQTLAALGDFSGASAAYHQFRRLLHEELRSEPTAETSARYRQIRRESRQRRSERSLPSRMPASDLRLSISPDPALRHFPRPLTTLIGRETAVEEIEKRLISTRLLTLVGTGGIGKTRLALATAEEVADEYADGVWFVELAALADADPVPQTVAITLGLSDEPGRSPLLALENFLQRKSLLLILDNCEHLTEACAHLAATLLSRCPDLRILATSRQSLGVMGEHLWRVPSLSLPELPRRSQAENADVSRLMESEAVRLFVARAQATSASFQVMSQNAAAVGQICRLLDGIPLALELAASWTKALPVEQIALRLNSRFQFLTGGNRTALPRHQTLRAALDWSYHLLTEAEQFLLCRLAVFADGWTLEAVESICAEEAVPAEEIVNLLFQLIDKSLVVYGEREEQARYSLLATTREYALEQWATAGRQSVTHRHAAYYLRLALPESGSLARAVDASAERIRLREEQENLRAALAWWRLADKGAGAKLALALWRCRLLSYHSAEAREWIACLQQEPSLFPSPESVVLYHAAGEWASWLGDPLAARRLWEKALAAATACEDQAGGASALLCLGDDAVATGDYALAQARYEIGLASFEALGEVRQAARARNCLGELAYTQGETEKAQRLVTHSLEIGRQRGDNAILLQALGVLAYHAYRSQDYESARLWLLECLQIERPFRSYETANTLRSLGAVTGAQGDYECAWGYLQEALALNRECGFHPGEGWVFCDMARVALRQGDMAQARDYLAQAIRIFVGLGEQGSVMNCLRRWAQMLAAGEEREDAARLWGHITGVYAREQWPVCVYDRDVQNREIAALRAAMEPAAWESAWAQGQALTTDTILGSLLKPV